MHIDYDIRLDNTFALVHLNPDGKIANGNTVSTAIKVLAAGVEEKNWSLVSDNMSEGLYIKCDNVITGSLDNGKLTFNFTENVELTNKTITLGYRKNLGQELIEVASATITLDVDRPFVDYDLSTSVKTITKKSDGTFIPSSFGVSILQKAVGSENIITKYDIVPNGYRVEYGTSGVINATEQLTKIIPDDNITDNIIPVKLIKTGFDGQDDIVVDRIDVAVIETSGKRGQMLYPAGVWKEDEKYKVTENAIPYVQYAKDNKYYILKSENDIEVSGSAKSPSNAEYWEPMETFSSVFTEAIVAPYGNIGGAVYYSHTTSDNNTYEFLFSKSGKANDTIESAEYSDFMIDVETDTEGANKVVD